MGIEDDVFGPQKDQERIAVADGGRMPDWWFRLGSEFEEAANPTHWMPLPALPYNPSIKRRIIRRKIK
jgi:hypothetical protein